MNLNEIYDFSDEIIQEKMRQIKSTLDTDVLTDAEIEKEVMRLKIITDKLWEEGSKSNGLTFSHTKESMELSDKILQNNIIQSLINENMNKKDWERARRREQVRVSGTKQRDRSIKVNRSYIKKHSFLRGHRSYLTTTKFLL
tara:strand:- start:665 stop:1090 length:426 start_codon:yes stop_codon:yes gene_type:complete